MKYITSKGSYITSLHALNIPSDEGTGDWHFYEWFMRERGGEVLSTIAGIDNLSTNEYLGDEGVFECSEILRQYGAEIEGEVYAANHYRAMSDMVFDCVKNNRQPRGSIILDDWLPELKEQERFFKMFSKLEAALNKQQLESFEAWKINQFLD